MSDSSLLTRGSGSSSCPRNARDSEPMAAGLPRARYMLELRSKRLMAQKFFLSTGEVTAARRVIVATEQPAAARLLKGESFEGRAQWHAYFSAPEAPSKAKRYISFPLCRVLAEISRL